MTNNFNLLLGERGKKLKGVRKSPERRNCRSENCIYKSKQPFFTTKNLMKWNKLLLDIRKEKPPNNQQNMLKSICSNNLNMCISKDELANSYLVFYV